MSDITVASQKFLFSTRFAAAIGGMPKEGAMGQIAAHCHGRVECDDWCTPRAASQRSCSAPLCVRNCMRGRKLKEKIDSRSALHCALPRAPEFLCVSFPEVVDAAELLGRISGRCGCNVGARNGTSRVCGTVCGREKQICAAAPP